MNRYPFIDWETIFHSFFAAIAIGIFFFPSKVGWGISNIVYYILLAVIALVTLSDNIDIIKKTKNKKNKKIVLTGIVIESVYLIALIVGFIQNFV